MFRSGNKLTLFLFLVFSVFTLALPAKASCFEPIARLLRPYLDNEIGTNGHPENRISYELGNIHSFIGWKEALLSRLWAYEALRGYHMANFDTDSYWKYLTAEYLPKDQRPPLPYALRPVRGLVHMGMGISRAGDLDFKHRFLLLPTKYVLSGLIKDFYSHAFMGLALGGTGYLMDSFGLSQNNPTYIETDPSDLEEDEVIVYVRLGGGDPVMDAENEQADQLEKKYAGKVVSINLTKEAGTTDKNAADKVIEAVEALKKKRIRIKKVIAMAHGEPGTVKWNVSKFNTKLSKLAEILLPLRERFSEKPEFYFNSCLLAGTLHGQKEVEQFAERIIPPGGFLEVNVLFGIAGTGYTRRGIWIDGSLNQKLFSLFSPVLAEGGSSAAFLAFRPIGQLFMDISASWNYQADYNFAAQLNNKYRVKVSGTEANPVLATPKRDFSIKRSY